MRLSVGKVRDHRVRVDLEVALPRVYSNAEPELIAFDGDIDLR